MKSYISCMNECNEVVIREIGRMYSSSSGARPQCQCVFLNFRIDWTGHQSYCSCIVSRKFVLVFQVFASTIDYCQGTSDCKVCIIVL